jgi:hypothetical protein
MNHPSVIGLYFKPAESSQRPYTVFLDQVWYYPSYNAYISQVVLFLEDFQLKFVVSATTISNDNS